MIQATKNYSAPHRRSDDPRTSEDRGQRATPALVRSRRVAPSDSVPAALLFYSGPLVLAGALSLPASSDRTLLSAVAVLLLAASFAWKRAPEKV